GARWRGYRARGRGAGPETLLPSPAYREPWHGHRKRCVARRGPPSLLRVSGWGRASARTVHPRWVQTADTAWNVLPSLNTNSRWSGRNFSPSGNSATAPSLTVVGAS